MQDIYIINETHFLYIPTFRIFILQLNVLSYTYIILYYIKEKEKEKQKQNETY